MTTRRTPHRPRTAFTLVETIAAMVVVSVTGILTSGIIFTAIHSYRDASTRAQLHNECSSAFDRISKLLWSIPRDSSAPVVAPLISSVTATSISWNNNWSLSLSGSQLMFTENGGTARPILENVTSFSIACFDESNTAMAASLSGAATQGIRRIQIQVTVSRQGISETLRARSYIRSLMTGAKVG